LRISFISECFLSFKLLLESDVRIAMRLKFFAVILSSFIVALGGGIAKAQEQTPFTGNEQLHNSGGNSLQQVTSVTQLSDVQPTDWAFQALQSLVERYGCIAGYPNGTFRGNRALTRYEFAAGLNACLDRVNELIAAGTANAVTKEDLATFQRLQETFASELASLRGRVDAVEAKAADLEAKQFSTTTKLSGEAIFALAGVATGEDIGQQRIDRVTTFSNRVRLTFETSFTGNDLLEVGLEAANTSARTNTLEGALSFESDTGNEVVIDAVAYQFPVGDRLTVLLAGDGVSSYDIADSVTILDGDGTTGAVSLFGARNPIFNLGDGAGLGLEYEFNDVLSISVGYLASEASNPTGGEGLFNGPYAALAQVLIQPSKTLKLAFTYTRGFNVETGTGSSLANFLTFADSLGEEASTTSDSIAFDASWYINKQIVLEGRVGYSRVNVVQGVFDGGNLDTLTWAVNLIALDLLKEGDMAGIIVGMEPRVTGSSNLGDLEDQSSSLHVEGFYEFQLSEHISVTPGVIWLTAPDSDSNNSDIVIGVIRTTFTF
jgi:hypothetical protein